jgi:hypothetical protein
MSLQNGEGTQTFMVPEDVIGQGPGNNFSLQNTFHTTINADGTVSVSFDSSSVDCK